MSAQLFPPYPLIRDGLRDGTVIPFLGSGASLGRAAPADAEEEAAAGTLPTAAELASQLARQVNFPPDELLELAKVAQYYDVVGGRPSLKRKLHDIFCRDYGCPSLHRHLAAIDRPMLVVTTNYDDLIEQAFRAAGKPFDLVVHTTDLDIGEQVLWWRAGASAPVQVIPNKLDLDLHAANVVYKMHGAVDRRAPDGGQYVITEDDYIDFLVRMTRNTAVPAVIAEAFQKRHFLFLGYGLRDWNMRVVLSRMERDLRRDQRLTSWAIQHRPSPLERHIWQTRNVVVYDMKLDSFVAELASQ
ncbi:MAG TPA: SIR2 family protein [Pyrinomonadaceae bacterium]|nr:SIR2 family protein [Pyrinomonadaceae bacterium]